MTLLGIIQLCCPIDYEGYSISSKEFLPTVVDIGEGNGKPIPVFLPGESQGQGSLVGCHLWGHTESDTTEVTQQQQ